MILARAHRPAAAPVAEAVSFLEVSKVYGTGPDALLAVDGVTLRIPRGEFCCIVGASGCGKSTLLLMMAGLEQPSAGSLEMGGRTAMMFQEPALFPWLTAAQNVAMPMRLQRRPRTEREVETGRLLSLVRLEEFGGRRPHELSGGMRQRVALARALAQQCDILLMDEPFAALDAITRDVLHDDLVRVWRETGVTIVFVTHNVREAARLGDRVVLLSSRPGRVVRQYGVDIPHPRRIDTPAVAAAAGEITDDLQREIGRHGDS